MGLAVQVLKIWADRDLLDPFQLEAAKTEALKRQATQVRRAGLSAPSSECQQLQSSLQPACCSNWACKEAKHRLDVT